MEQKLNEGQLQAIRHGDGPVMVLAGPGSGKTTVITRRIEYLIRERGVNPSHILVITFTKAAAGEMKQRFLGRKHCDFRHFPCRIFYDIKTCL